MFLVVLYTAVLPGLAAGLAALAARAWLGVEGSVRCGALAVLLAFVTGFLLSFGSPMPIDASYQWVFWGGGGGATAALLLPRKIGASKPGGAGVPALAALLTAPFLYGMLLALVPRYLGRGELVLIGLSLGFAAAMTAWAAGDSARRLSAARLAPAWTVWAGLAAGVLMAGGSARMAQVAGFLAAAIGALMVLSWWQPTFAWLRRAAPPLVLILVLAAANLYWYGDDARAPALLLLLAPPLLHWLWARSRWAGRLPAAAEALLLTAASAAPLTWALLNATAGGGEDDLYSY